MMTTNIITGIWINNTDNESYHKKRLKDRIEWGIKSHFIRLGTEYEKNDYIYLRSRVMYEDFVNIHWGKNEEIYDVRYNRYWEIKKIAEHMHRHDNKKPFKVLNKIIKKRRRRENARNKYIECLSQLEKPLPHEIDNIIISYCI
jgi:hypothetical protein